jgi:catechol-2,3-dioxygenase
MGDKNYHHHLAINSWFSDTRVTDDEPQLRCFTITYPSCEKYLHTLEKLKQANITYQETPEGIYIKDPENTCIYLKI